MEEIERYNFQRSESKEYAEILNNKSIVAYLSEIQPHLKFEKILADPVDSKTLREIYEQILLNYLDMSREEFGVAFEDAYEVFEHRQLHQKSVSELLFFKQFVSFLNAISIPGFSYQNWIQPTAKVTKYVLSGIINFVKFSEEKIMKHAEATEETEALRDACEVEDEEIATLEAELKQIKLEIAAEQPDRERLFHENDNFKKQLSRLNQDQFDLQLVCQKKEKRKQ